MPLKLDCKNDLAGGPCGITSQHICAETTAVGAQFAVAVILILTQNINTEHVVAQICIQQSTMAACPGNVAQN